MGGKRAACAAILLLAGCGGGGIVEREVSPARNLFEYRAVFDGAAGHEDLVWPVSEGRERATVSWEGTEVTAGELVLVIRDAEGREVYRDRAIGGAPETALTARGPSGDWRVEIEFTRLVGTVQVRATAVNH
jgi:hypothetical protein